MDGYTMSIDMVIDHNGVIHVVWDWRMTSTYWLIMYSKSENDGYTWSEPTDLLHNTDLWMSQPHIACDSENKLYVTYTYDGHYWTPEGRLIKMIDWDGQQWSESVVVSEVMPGSHHNRIKIDYNNRLYIRWDYEPTGDDYIRISESNTWYDQFCPYPGSEEIYALVEADVDSSNSLHWIGGSSSINYYGERLKYFFYEYLTNKWYAPQNLTNDTILEWPDIKLNNDDIPEIVYRKTSTNSVGDATDSAIHTIRAGIVWLPPDLVSGTDKQQKRQQIAIDKNNCAHVVEVEYYNSPNSENEIVHYYYNEKEWVCQPIDSATHMVNYPKMVFSGNQIYVVYYKGDAVFSGDIWISKYDVITSVKDKVQENTNLKIYPNPSLGDINIEFSNNEHQHINLSVFDMSGKLIKTLCNKTLPPGRQRLLWNGTDQSGKEVQSGSYLVRLKTGSKTAAQIVEIIK